MVIGRRRPWLLFGLPLALSLAAAAALAQPQRTVVVAVDDAHPPYVYAQKSQAAGAYVEVLTAAMRELPGWRLKLVLRPWARALQEAQQGRVDAFLPPYREVNRDWVTVFAGPLHTEEVVLSCAARVRIGPASRWPEDFAGLRIGTTRAYLLSHELSAAIGGAQVKHREFRQGRDALAALAHDEIDCYGNDALDIEHSYSTARADQHWAPRMPGRLEAPFLLSSQKAYLGVSTQSLAQRPELADFVEALNARLAQMRASGEIKRLMDEALALRK